MDAAGFGLVTRSGSRNTRWLATIALAFGLAVWGCGGNAGPRGDPFWNVSGHEPMVADNGLVVRHGPIITAAMVPGRDGRNINVPSMIEAPEWLSEPLGRYYLYFSSHLRGRYIRLAFSDQVTGPWQVFEPGTLRVDQALEVSGYVSAPEVVVDDENRQIRMYFNSRDAATEQGGTFVAVSQDGLGFEVAGGPLGPTYSRVLHHDGWYYLFLGANGQRVLRSRNGIGDWERGPMVLPRRQGDEPYSRHIALHSAGEVLRVFYTRKRDVPESILMGTIDLGGEWQEWRVEGDRKILRPEMPYEGAVLPVRPSRHGPAAREGEHAVRDPAIFEAEGRTWLLYTFAGERGIALAELLI